MTEYRINERCIIGMPACGYGFGSARVCFIGRPADGEFQLEEDILRQLLKERNYDGYVALQRLDPGNFAFCTKICSQIITSQFCIVLLNESAHVANPAVKMPNPNVHLEYGMMLSFHKHVIPMQREAEQLAFNIAPLDTIKYKPETFRDKAEQAIDDAILRFATKEPPGRPIGPQSDVLKYMSFKGLRYSDVTNDPTARVIFQIGSLHGYNLFDGQEQMVFFGYFHEVEAREIVVRVKFLLSGIAVAYKNLERSPDSDLKELAVRILNQLRIEILVPEKADIAKMAAIIDSYQTEVRRIPVLLRHPSEIEDEVKAQYDAINI
jgi:hypothetical protein